MGILSQFAIFRIGQNENKCLDCRACEKACEGGCEPAVEIHHAECILCMNCLEDCKHNTISYQTRKSTADEITGPDISRRVFLTTIGSGLFLMPSVRLAGYTDSRWPHTIIRPPGACTEKEFLARCLKCGQCMRICPTNVIQPGTLSAGLENIWTPTLDFRAGTSGCQYNCVACAQSCPTAAIRPISLDEKHGKGTFRKKGPISIGTAFFDRSRCLPWTKGLPCIVCQENCPVSPKAIYTDEYFEPIRKGIHRIKKIKGRTVILFEDSLEKDVYSSGDYYISLNNKRYRIKSNSNNSIETTRTLSSVSEKAIIYIRLQRPYMDIAKCIGCGICEHECPVQGLKAVRISAEGETRDPEKKILLKKTLSS